jgi:hypothetical protein
MKRSGTMTKHQELAKRRSEYLGTAQPSSRDLVIAQMLDLAGQIHRQEVLPSEVKFWSEAFKNEKPESLAWAFREHLRTGKFFPKPADITELLERRRLAFRSTFVPVDRKRTEEEQSTPEFKELQAKMDALLKGMTMPNTGGKK